MGFALKITDEIGDEEFDRIDFGYLEELPQEERQALEKCLKEGLESYFEGYCKGDATDFVDGAEFIKSLKER